MLSKMPKADDAKTKSAPKKKYFFYGVFILVAFFLLLAPTLFYQPATADLTVAGKTVALEIASTDAAREKGLGGRRSMPDDRGMLFVLSKPAATCFWMKDMLFPLDIIWLNTDKQVIYLAPRVSPKTYPKSYCPSAPAKYVIELNSGQAQKLDINPGKMLSF